MDENLDDRPAGLRDRSLLRTIALGAAGVGILGGGALGFLWVSSTPGAQALGASAAPTSVPTSGTSAGPTTTGDASGFAFSGRDLFGGGIGTTPAAPGGATDGTSLGTPTGSSTLTSAVTGAATSTTAVKTPTSDRTPTGTSGTSGSSATTTAPVATSPSSSPTTASSTTPGWEKPTVKFVSGSDARGVFDVDGEIVTVPKGALIRPLSVRYGGVVADSTATATASPISEATATASVLGIFLTENDPRQGWLVPSNAEEPTSLPDAALGRTTGKVYLGGVLRDQYWVRVDRSADVLLNVGDPVPGTSLQLSGVRDTRVPAASAFFTDSAGIVYFGTMGEGTTDGVLH